MEASVRVQERIEVLSNRTLAAGLMADAERLNTLDDLWTRYLADAEDESELQDDRPGLQSLVGEMISLLSEVNLASRELGQLMIEFPSDLDVELELLFEHHPAHDHLLDARPSGLFAAVAGEACLVVEQESPRAMAELAEKLRTIAEGEFQPGDLHPKLKCAVILVGAAAGLMSVVAGPGALVALPPAVLAGGGVVGTVASLITGWNGWSCREHGSSASA